MSITVYIHYEPPGKDEKTSKIVIPKGWTTTKTVSDVIQLFAKSYNSKNPDNAVVTSEVHLETNENEKIYSNSVCGTVLGDHCDYFIKNGSHESVRKVENSTGDDKRLRCKNYGCQQYYTDDGNVDGNCQHHTGPPVFHDTYKYWSCCPDRKSYDFEGFQQIVGCAQGKHSQVNTGMTISASPNSTTTTSSESSSSSTTTTTVLKSISEYNETNPDAVSAAQNASKIISGPRKSSRNTDGITAKCQRNGCQKQFKLIENTITSCIYHKGSPIFHDAVKFWSCCPIKKCYDFDEFMNVVGCCNGYHDDGVIDLHE